MALSKKGVRFLRKTIPLRLRVRRRPERPRCADDIDPRYRAAGRRRRQRAGGEREKIVTEWGSAHGDGDGTALPPFDRGRRGQQFPGRYVMIY